MKPVTREEMYLASASGETVDIPTPVTRREKFLNAAATGNTNGLPEPTTREEMYLKSVAENSGGGGSAVLIEKSVVANGTYSASDDSADGYSQVSVSVPNSYSAGDEGKVVQSGALVSQTATSTTTNGTIDTTTNNSVVVNVANSYSAADEGKVVSNGALVAQGSDTVTQNGTVDTTLISSLIVNVSGGGGLSQIKELTTQGSVTYSDIFLAEADNFFYLFGSINATATGNLTFSIPSDFDLTHISATGKGEWFASYSSSSLNIRISNDTVQLPVEISSSDIHYLVVFSKSS